MDLAHRLRITLAAAIAIVAATSVALAGSVSAGPPAPVLLPDLRTLEPFDSPSLELERKGPAKIVLRLSNRIVNAGGGPLELLAGPSTQSCTDAGQYPGNDLEATQRLFEDTNGSGEFDAADQVADEPKVGCFEYHPQHGHWHFRDFAQYSVADVHTGELLFGPSKKIGFCILDGERALPQLPGSPPNQHFSGAGCGQGDPDDGPAGMGLSVGWADTYTSFLPGQRLNISGVEKGIYCLISTANPVHPVDDPSQIEESDTENNSRRQRIRINPDTDKVDWLDRKCPSP